MGFATLVDDRRFARELTRVAGGEEDPSVSCSDRDVAENVDGRPGEDGGDALGNVLEAAQVFRDQDLRVGSLL